VSCIGVTAGPYLRDLGLLGPLPVCDLALSTPNSPFAKAMTAEDSTKDEIRFNRCKEYALVCGREEMLGRKRSSEARSKCRSELLVDEDELEARGRDHETQVWRARARATPAPLSTNGQ